MKMYQKAQDIQQYTLNNKSIIAEVAIEEKKKNNQISTNNYVRTYHVMTVWITFLKNQRNVFNYQQMVEDREGLKIIWFILYR